MKHPISTTPGYVGGLVTGHIRPEPVAMDPQRERESAIAIAQECGAFRFIWKMAQDPPSYTRFTDAQLAAFVARIRNAGVAPSDKAGPICRHGIHMDNACGACEPPRGTTVRPSGVKEADRG